MARASWQSEPARYRAELRSEARAVAYLAGFWYVVAVVGLWALIQARGDVGAAVAVVQGAIGGVL